MLTRRELMKRSLLCSLTPAVPTFLARTARAAGGDPDGRVLVVVELNGGNDGLNTVVPFRDEQYARLRPQIKLAPERLIKLTDELGLHPAMRSAGELFEAGRFAIVQGVGYPNPNRSHFRSMAVWQSARLDSSEQDQYGWLGRALDAGRPVAPHAVYVGSEAPGVALWGRSATVAAIHSLDDLALLAPSELLRASTALPAATDGAAQMVARLADEAFTSAQRLTALAEVPVAAGSAGFGGSQLGRNLRTVATLIESGCPSSVYYTVHSGYDTHAGQTTTHSSLLGEFSTAVGALVARLAASGLGERVLLLAYGEFGRRAAENASAGTDHGAAAPVFLAGPQFTESIVGPQPDLARLDRGDVPMAIDFRQVYATVLERWLGVPAAEVLGGPFEPLPLFSA